MSETLLPMKLEMLVLINFIKNCNFVGFKLLFGKILATHFKFLLYFIWQRITDNGSLPETRIWSILLYSLDFDKMVYQS